MKYFTRGLYRAIQDGTERTEKEWHKAAAAYDRHLQVLGVKHPELAHLARLDLHDGIVRAVRHRGRKLQIVVDASNNPWGPRGEFVLKFSGVASFAAGGTIVGDWWLYNEVHVAQAGFALHVLLHKSWIIVKAAQFELQTLRGAD